MGLQLFIWYNLNQQYYSIDVESSDTIQSLADKIGNLTGTLPVPGTLYHNDETLSDFNLTSSDYNIQKFHTVVYQNPLPPSPPCPPCPSCPKPKYVGWILTVSILSFFLIFSISRNLFGFFIH